MIADPADPAETIGQRLRVARTNAGMTGAQVSSHLGVSVQQISNIENRGDGVSAQEVFGLADLLSVDARWLATGH